MASRIQIKIRIKTFSLRSRLDFQTPEVSSEDSPDNCMFVFFSFKNRCFQRRPAPRIRPYLSDKLVIPDHAHSFLYAGRTGEIQMRKRYTVTGFESAWTSHSN